MKKILFDVLFPIALGFLLMVGVRIGEWVLLKPEVKLLVCITDKSELLGNCKPFDEIINKVNKSE